MGRFSSEPPRIVFSTDRGSLCPDCGEPAHSGTCAKAERTENRGKPAIVRMERAGRKGKTVTVISGLTLSAHDLKELLKSLKQQCGTGGAITDNDLEIQGDHRDRLVELLIARGIAAKRG